MLAARCSKAFFAAAAALLGTAAAAQSHVVSPRSFRLDSPRIRPAECRRTVEDHDFGGETRPACCIEYPWRKGADLIVEIPLGGIDMMDDFPTIDFFVERSARVAYAVEYRGSHPTGGTMQAKGNANGPLVEHVRRELVHEPSWANWMDCRGVQRIRMRFSACGWADTNVTQRVWISDVRFSDDDSWKGTERDERFRFWVGWCDRYEPDLSDSSACLEPPQDGRLASPIALVEDHEPRAEIVAPKDVYGTIELAARELQYWIGRMTGAKLPIVEKPTGEAKARIFLNAPEAHVRWREDVEWLKAGADVDGWFVHVDGIDVHIACAVPNDVSWTNAASFGLPRDACPVGTFRGVVAFLENNSTTVFASPDAKIGTVYDEAPTFTVRWGEGRSRPATCGRGWLSGNDYRNTRKIPVLGVDMWRARNYTNLRLPHRLSGHAARSGEMIEYFPNTVPYQTFDGESRIPHGYYKGQVCLGAPDALSVAVSNGVRKVRRCLAEKTPYPVTSIGFWNEDNWRVCACGECTKPIRCDDGAVLVSCGKTSREGMPGAEALYRSTQYMRFVNALADGVAAECPGVKTEILAYLFQYPAPKCAISPNVAWVSCPWHRRASHAQPLYHPVNRGYFENITSMLSLGGEMRVYDYQAFGPAIRLDAAFAEVAAEDYRWYARHGARCTGAEMAYVTDPKKPVAMMNGWLFGRVGWTAAVDDVEKLRKWYLRRVYREGAPAAEEYFARYRRKALRGAPRGSAAAKMLTGDEAREVFGRYMDKISNPIARAHYEILMKVAVGK